MIDLADDAQTRMKKSMNAMGNNFKTIRTGRANTAIFEKIRVEAYGQMVPLNETATIAIPEARMVVIQPWDVSNLTEIERAIQKSDLGLNPGNDGKVIRISIPPLTEERRKDIVKQARNVAEQTRISVRNIRRDLNDNIKLEKENGLSEDDAKRQVDIIQNLTNKTVTQINDLLAVKEKEIMEI